MFEITSLPTLITGNCQIIEGPSSASAPADPAGGGPTNKFVQTDQPFRIQFNWNQISNSWILNGNWEFRVEFELRGPGEAPFGFSATLASTPLNGVYIHDINVPAASLIPGIYDVSCSMQFYSGGNPKPIVAFEDLEAICVYQES